MDASDSISVCCRGDIVCLRILGRGTFKNSVPVKVFVQRMMARGGRQFVVDLESCTGMDSTFMGTLTGVVLRLNEQGGGKLEVINAGERNRELLEDLGLDHIFSVHSDHACYGQFAQEQKLDVPAADAAATKRAVIEAHEALIEEGDEKNEERFRDLLDHLKSE